MGLAEGLALHSYINELPRKEEEAKLKAQLFKSQADHLNAQTGLLTLQQQQEQGFQSAMQQALAPQQPQGQSPLPPDVASQPAGPNAGAPSIGTLHDTTAFADPDSQQMLRMSRLALSTGNPVGIKHAATMAQGALEIQKTQLAYRTQQLQDMAAFYQQSYDALPDVPANAAQRLQIRQALGAILFKQGKNEEAMKLLGGQLTPLNPGSTLMRTPMGGAPEAIGQSPISLGQMEYEKEKGKDAYQAGKPPPGTTVPPRPSAPVRRMPSRAAVEREAAQRPQDTPHNDPVQQLQILEDQGVPADVIQQVAPYLLKPTASQATPAWAQPAPANESPEARKVRVQHQTQLDTEAGRPGATAGDVAAVKEAGGLRGQTGVRGATRETLAAQQSKGAAAGEGLDVRPGAKSVQEQKDEIAQRTQALPSSEVDKLAPLLDVRSYLEELRTIPEEKMQQYVGLLRGPLAKVQQVVADTLEGPGKGDPDLHKFLSIVNQIFYTTNRPETGANFSGVEKEMVNGIYATGTERSYTEFKAKLDRLDKTLETRIGNRTALTMSTRGNTGKVMEKPGERAATPPQETPQQLYEKLKAKVGIK